jgi:hypothetical protein
MPLARASLQPNTLVTPASLRSEGVIEIGRAIGTSLLFVRTLKMIHMFHVRSVPDRALDAYAVTLAVNWIENGVPSVEVAGNLDVDQKTLCRALAQAGYERLSPSQTEQRRHARMSYKLGNRRGRLVFNDPKHGTRT